MSIKLISWEIREHCLLWELMSMNNYDVQKCMIDEKKCVYAIIRKEIEKNYLINLGGEVWYLCHYKSPMRENLTQLGLLIR